ncbi:MAG: hypothetical protein FGF53_06880 [Candidatus Brockarchaeota archaeon]|nr:hypothetical protein [Candidatus Brockarchaeota archaeon]MBO3809472.1 hypothetical protein [Candidatus Brockarchaeota archaeon]
MSHTATFYIPLRSLRDFHVLDFNIKDWTYYNEHDPVKSHKVARFRYTLHLARQLNARFGEPHFISP